MDKNTYNHDKFNTWQVCKRRYYFKYVKELNWPELNDSYKLGQSVHALIDYYLRGLKIDHILKNTAEETQKHYLSILNSPISKNEVIATEWAFNSRIGNSEYWLNGRIDAIFYNKQEKKYIIADWKTGQNVPKDPESSFQSRIYLYALYNGHKDLELSLKQDDIAFQYIKTPDMNNPESIIYSAEKEKLYENDFLKIIKDINNEKTFEKNQPCPMLKYCPYKIYCNDL